MKPMLKHILMGMAGLICLAIIALIVCGFYDMKPPFDRVNEKLPNITIENGSIIYCRMRYCDFRFPLPENVRIVRTNIESGGYDTINGSVYVIGTNDGPANLREYAEYLQRMHWNVRVVSGVGCNSCTNVPDVPFVSSGQVIHYPLFDEIYGSSKNQDGGTFTVNTEDHMTKIHFAYFGDY
jgi:hypothetical protein